MTYQEAWDELVLKSQYATGGMEITEFQKSLIVWADSWVRAAQQSVQADATYCPHCGELMSSHFISERGGFCEPPRVR